jgi:hypothetical protein
MDMDNKEITLNNLNDLKSKLKELKTDNWIRFNISDDIFVVITLAQISFIGNMKMTLNDSYTIILESKKSMVIHNKVTIPSGLLEYYLDLFSKSTSLKEAENILLLAKHQFKIGDRIEFAPDKANRVKIGSIVNPKDNYCGLLYRVIKKNGELSTKEYLLYVNAEYKLLDREFIDYKKL